MASDGEHVTNVDISLHEGATVTAKLGFDGPSPPPNGASLRVVLTLQDRRSAFGTVGENVVGGQRDQAGAITWRGLPAGTYVFRQYAGQNETWRIESIHRGGRDISDAPLTLSWGERVDDITVMISQRLTEIGGRVVDSRGAPVSATTVVIFAEDRQFWTPQSRRVATTRTAIDGSFRTIGLPPGDYRVAASRTFESGGEADPTVLSELRGSATRVTVTVGEKQQVSVTIR